MSSEGFLSRWSRRKQEVRQTEKPVPDTEPTPAETPTPETASDRIAGSGADEPVAPSEPELSAEDLAKLPSLDELTADTDLSVFLRRGVPEQLRNAALRRVWSLDPKIRDFVSEAREYAYDWNTPGGVPGFGPLTASGDEIARMAARIVGGDKFEPCIPEQSHSAAGSSSHIREQPSSSDVVDDIAETETAVTHKEKDPCLIENASVGKAIAQANVIAPEPEREPNERQESASATQQSRTDEPSAAATRRHGGAMPV